MFINLFRMEATDRRMEVLSAKTRTRIGFWNVRTMYETGKLSQVTIYTFLESARADGQDPVDTEPTRERQGSTVVEMKIYQRPKNLHTLGALSDMTVGQAATSRTASVRPEMRLEWNNVWKSSQYSTKTKLRLYQSCVISSLLYGLECWKMTESDLNKLSTFHMKNLRRILHIFWPETIYNQELLARCNQDSMGTTIMRRRCKWIGHVMRREQDNITPTALHWTPEGRHRQGRPKITWRRTVEAELKTLHHTWGTIQRLARDRQEWLNFVAALHAKPAYGHE